MTDIKKITKLVSYFKTHNILLWVEGSTLKYKVPQGGMTQESISILKENKNDIIQFLKRNKGNLKLEKIPSINNQDSYDISNAQRRLWVLDQFEKDSVVYNMPAAFILEGKLKTDAFRQAYSYMLERHESLRTVFIEENGEPKQKILKNPDFDIDIIDLRDSLDVEKEARVISEKDLQTPFNLEVGPLVRFTIMELEDEKFLLLFNMHHIISDGWSMNIFIKEFLVSYGSFKEGNTPELAPLRIHYKDYSAWQNALLDSPEMDNQREYWLDKLSGDLPVLVPPSDNIRPVTQTFNGNSIGFVLPAEINSALNGLCLETKSSMFMMLQALVKVLFHRYTGQEDIILGSPVAGRVHEDLENQIGFFVNTLSFRDTIEGGLTFKEFLVSVKKTCTDAFDNQDYPFDSLVEELNIKRDLSRSPLYDVMVVLQNNETAAAVELDGLKLSPYNTENTISKFDMSFNFSESGEGLFCGIEYNTDIYSEDRIKRMVDHLRLLISSVLDNPESKVKDLDIIPVDEMNLLLNVFNDTKTDYPADKSIIDLFEDQVDNTPDNIAVVFEDVELTYRELNEKANIVGHYLRDNYEIEPDDLVGVMLNRSERMIIVLLGILKSGAAYLPLDPEYPVDRIEYMLKDSYPKVVLRERDSDFENDIEILDINDVLQSDKSVENPGKITTPNNLAYVIYTSGSTGKPKGVMIENRNVINLSFWHINEFELSQVDVVSQYASMSFDASVWEIIPSLISGASIHVIKHENRMNLDILASYFKKNLISVSFLPTPIYEKFQRRENLKLRVLLTGGDKLESYSTNNYKLYNNYGPTENSVVSTFHRVENNSRNIPIGSPISNTIVYIIDKNYNPTPLGVPGELCISGDGLARGYLNKPELTAEKFVENPFLSGDRMYRTGDLARWLPDGNIEFLGRIDNQVKIRGFRIELGEIENSLLQHHEISSATVVAKEVIDGDKQLVAYFVSDKEVEPFELRSFLKRSLPDYMIPSFFVDMEKLPLTPNGKIDRKALPEVDGSVGICVEYVAPSNVIQEKLVEIWQDVLGIERIGIHDNFFDLGGHSLKATKVVSRIDKDLDVDIALRDIFESQTIEALSLVIKSTKKTEYIQIEEIPVQESYDISNAQRRLWVLDQFDEKSVAYNMPAAFILEGKLNKDAFKEAYSYLIDRHESLRTVFIAVDGEPRQRILMNPVFNVEIVDLKGSSDPEKEAGILFERDISSPFDLETGPLVRLMVVSLEDKRHLFLFNMHHIISDGWSMNIFISEFVVCYNSFRERGIPDFKPLRIHYKDYSAWQNNLMKSGDLNGQREYWLEKLSGELPVLDLPSDFTRPAVQTFNGNSIEFCLSKEIKSALNDLCKDNNVSLFMLLKTFVIVLLHKYTGQQDIIVGSPIAGRVHQDLEDQIGFYLNNLVLRNTIENNQRFSEFLRVAAQTCIEAFENQSYPFDKIVEDLDLKRDLSRTPLFDILVILQNNETIGLDFDGLSVLPYKNDKGIVSSKFDITFDFNEISSGIICILKYNTDIYSEDRIGRMGKHLETLITSVVENPECKIEDLDIIPNDEKKILLDQFNNTNIDYPVDKTIVNLFEEQAEKTPDNIAIIFKEVELTYRKLNEKANLVANYLLANYNIGQDEYVGIFLNRSEKMVIALLGILKSGAAYVPIEVDYPEDRQKYILEDSSPQLIISDYSNKDNNIIDIDEILNRENDINNPGIFIRPESSLYILYTSGTTGKPKGIITKHENVTNFVFWGREYFFDNKIEGNFGLFSSISFDFTSTSLYLSLLRGKKLTIYDQRDDINTIIFNVFNDANVDSVKLTPSHISLLQGLEIRNSNIKLVITGGEELLINHVKILRETSSDDFKIVNAYGPTESTMTCIVKTVREESEKILIGKPMGNVKIYIMCKKGLSAIGIPGEICVSGRGISKGYLNKVELTSEKFVANPFSPNEKMYRTGDLGCWLPDGNIKFLGRIDNQVKIRGFRVEPGEIERTLLEYKSIDSAIVVVNKNINGENELLAYYVSDDELEITKMRNFLKGFLPDYMIPLYFFHIECIPLTPNGKVDKNVLPQPDGTFCTGVEYVAPRNETEEKLKEIWQEILKNEKIGIHDNFFELGGHSLKATRVVSQISKEFDVNISLSEIFKNPTIETISRIIDSANKIEYKQIEKIPEKESYDISNAQKRLWVLDQFEEKSIAYNMPSALILDGNFETDSFRQAYSFMINRHESLRTVFISENGNPKQKILKYPQFDIEIIDIRNSSDIEKEARLLAEKDLHTPFNLNIGPLVRFTIIRLEDEKVLLLLNMHHIISDGWSMSIFIKEFLASYGSLKDGNTPELTPLRIQYKDYSAWQNNLLDSSGMDNQREYWLDKLSGKLPILDLPSDNIRPATQTFNGNNISFVMPEEINLRLNDLCLESKASLFMMLQALVKVLFHRYTGQEDIILGSPIAGRVHQDLENQIGFYVNSLCLRDTIEGGLTFKEFLENVKQTCTDAFDNQDYPFDRLVEELDIKRDISRSPLFDVTLVLQNNETVAVEFDGLNLSSYNTENTISKFDMSFNYSERDGSLFCGIDYNTDIYSKDRIKRMAEHFKTLVTSVLDNPESTIKDLEIIPAQEKSLLLNVFNDTKTDYPSDKTIINLFEEQVERTPDNIAVVFENVNLTYKELNEKANIVGHFLRNKYNIKPDDLVGVLLERSEKIIIAILGILKSGAAYVPLDPEYPEDRIEYMLKDASPKVVLSEGTDFLVNKNESLDINKVLQADLSVENPFNITTPNHLAYVIYTSGSTGKSKGVLIEHRGIVNLSTWQKELFHIDHSSNVAQLFSYSFDGAVGQTFMALLNGGKLFLLDINNIVDESFFNQNNITNIVTVPSFLKILNPNKIYSKDLTIVSVGEICTKDLAKTWSQKFRFINGYGPSEYSVYSHIFEVVLKKINGNQTIPIGRSISNTQTYILSDKYNLSPLGVVGEIFISGSGLARGYLNNFQRTYKNFIPNHIYLNGKFNDFGKLNSCFDQLSINQPNHVLLDESINCKHLNEIQSHVIDINNDLTQKTADILEKYRDNDFFNNCFNKYLIEGKKDTYHSSGIPKDILLKILGKNNLQGLKGVDFGFGDATVLNSLIESGASMVGFDMNPYFIESARKRNLDVQMIKIDESADDFLDKCNVDRHSCDFIISNLVLDRVENPKNMLKNMLLLLKTNGHLAIQTLLPVLPFDDDSDDLIQFTPDHNRISPGLDADQDKLYLVSILYELGLRNINIFSFNMEVATQQGISSYLVWSFSCEKQFELTESSNYYSRLYKTGDLARWLPDGNIEFFGRIDNQVKIRGFRIEIGEIENCLLEHEEVNFSVVVAKEGIEGDKQLIAYIASDKELEHSHLRNHLGKYLPYYMIPSFFIHMKTFPLTPNGKIDRNALPDVIDRIGREAEYVAPENEIQEKIVQIWQKVLGIEKVGIHDNFFELGGHSLKGTRVISQVMRELEVDVVLKDIFENQTVKTFSVVIFNAKKKVFKQIDIVTEQQYYDLSNAQRRLWIINQFEKESIVYNMPKALILEGKLKTDAFRQAYSFMIRRHESLRTVFTIKDGVPKQQVLCNPSFDIELIDLRYGNNIEKEAKILAENDLKTPFNLEVGPLVRFTIMRLEKEKYLLLFNMHHIISDGWSMNIFISEFLACYNSFKVGNTPELTPLRIQYKDYSVWHNSLLGNNGIDHQREYWLDKLSGKLPVLDLPADNIRPVTQTFNGNNISFILPKEINSALYNLCLEYKASLFMMLQALVKVLFYRYTGQNEIILGSPIAGRGHEDLENQIGYYINTLCLKDNIDGDLTFKEFLGRVKKTCKDAFDNQDYPFDRLVEELDIKRDLSRSPLFDVMLILQNNDEVSVEFNGLNITPYITENTISKLDLTFNFSEYGEDLFCSIEYNTDIFSVDRIKRMIEHLKLLISSVLDNPEAIIKDLDLIPFEEKELILNVFNDTQKDFPIDKTIVDLFEEQVAKTPYNIAVVYEETELTYRELNEQSNIVGNYLRENYNIKPNDLVGILLERSEKMIIALLGILKSGAAYLPLDPEYPLDRIEYMLKDSKPELVISGQDKGIFVDINLVLESGKSNRNLTKLTSDEDLAYVIYTSGSTGKPKGTLLSNSSVVNFIKGMTDRIDFKPEKTIVSVTTVSFDIFVTETFLPLAVGQKIILANKKQQTDPYALKELIINNKVNMIQSTPSRIKMFTSDISLLETLSSLSEIMVGGEPFPEDLLEILKKHCTGRIYNMYGPTETTVWSTLALLNDGNSIHIGKPLANTRIEIIDKDKNLVPVGVYGEMYIRGDGLSTGYLNNSGLSDKKFIKSPSSPNEKTYRTGDLARWLPDGNIEFLGRIDNQVKIRGFRIELGEIENSLLLHKEINSAVVMTKEINDGDKQLVAYFVSDNKLELTKLREFLRKSLPDYMVPFIFIHIDKIPLTPSGKIDRKALSDVDGRISSNIEFIAPENEIQRKLVQIWQEIIGIKKVGILDSFFELGGDSLKAIRVVTRINNEFLINISLNEIFTNPTIKFIAELINAKQIAFKLKSRSINITKTDEISVRGRI